MGNEEKPFDFSFQVEEATWPLLKPHYNRGSLLLVDNSLDLLEVARAMAGDQVELVSGWLESSLIRKPLQVEASRWDRTPDLKMANFTIVQPYVLFQLRPKEQTQ